MNNKCIICTDTEYNIAGHAYICDTCANNPTLVCTYNNLYTVIDLPHTCHIDVNILPYCHTRFLIPIERYFKACLEKVKDHPIRVKKVQKCKDIMMASIKLILETEKKKKQIIENVKIAATKFSVIIDFETNSVQDIIDKQINLVGIDDINVTTLIINDLYNYSLSISNKDSLDKLILDRMARLDKIIDDYARSSNFTDLENTSFRNQFKEYLPVKELYEKFCVLDKGKLSEIQTELYRILGLTVSKYKYILMYKKDLAVYGITVF